MPERKKYHHTTLNPKTCSNRIRIRRHKSSRMKRPTRPFLTGDREIRSRLPAPAQHKLKFPPDCGIRMSPSQSFRSYIRNELLAARSCSFGFSPDDPRICQLYPKADISGQHHHPRLICVSSNKDGTYTVSRVGGNTFGLGVPVRPLGRGRGANL